MTQVKGTETLLIHSGLQWKGSKEDVSWNCHTTDYFLIISSATSKYTIAALDNNFRICLEYVPLVYLAKVLYSMLPKIALCGFEGKKGLTTGAFWYCFQTYNSLR